MKKLIIISMVLISLQTSAQTNNKTLVASQTFLSSTEKTVKVTTSADAVIKYMQTNFSDSLKSVSIRYKNDRNGRYAETSFSFPITMMPALTRYFKASK